MTDLPFRVRPDLDDTNRFFWTSGEDGRLRFLRCVACGFYLHPPGPRCPDCGGVELRPEPVSGRAVVATFTVNHQPWVGESDPYVIAIVELEEQDGLRLTTNIVRCPVDEVAIGMDVQVTFEHQAPIWYPLFERADG